MGMKQVRKKLKFFGEKRPNWDLKVTYTGENRTKKKQSNTALQTPYNKQKIVFIPRSCSMSQISYRDFWRNWPSEAIKNGENRVKSDWF